ncbi:MAG: hypothetical protein AMK71_07875 [Nitrospira bacterium SG8_35_4]|nr:MAG: hypothetical protein AMK71_07875 [Nitrospira bacterium SG8_35_4]
MRTINIHHTVLLFVIIFAITGCSSIQIKHHSLATDPPLCKADVEKNKVAVFRDTAWRHNQKESEIREELVDPRIKVFYTNNHCMQTLDVSREIEGRCVLLPLDSEII